MGKESRWRRAGMEKVLPILSLVPRGWARGQNKVTAGCGAALVECGRGWPGAAGSLTQALGPLQRCTHMWWHEADSQSSALLHLTDEQRQSEVSLPLGGFRLKRLFWIGLKVHDHECLAHFSKCVFYACAMGKQVCLISLSRMAGGGIWWAVLSACMDSLIWDLACARVTESVTIDASSRSLSQKSNIYCLRSNVLRNKQEVKSWVC